MQKNLKIIFFLLLIAHFAQLHPHHHHSSKIQSSTQPTSSHPIPTSINPNPSSTLKQAIQSSSKQHQKKKDDHKTDNKIIINDVTDYVACGSEIDSLCQRISQLTLEDNTTDCQQKNLKIQFGIKNVNGIVEESDGYLKQIDDDQSSFITFEQTKNDHCQIIKK